MLWCYHMVAHILSLFPPSSVILSPPFLFPPLLPYRYNTLIKEKKCLRTCRGRCQGIAELPGLRHSPTASSLWGAPETTAAPGQRRCIPHGAGGGTLTGLAPIWRWEGHAKPWAQLCAGQGVSPAWTYPRGKREAGRPSHPCGGLSPKLKEVETVGLRWFTITTHISTNTTIMTLQNTQEHKKRDKKDTYQSENCYVRGKTFEAVFPFLGFSTVMSITLPEIR